MGNYDLIVSNYMKNACWTTCNGGFCCSNNHPDFDFDFMTTNGTDIIYLPREYKWQHEKKKTFLNQMHIRPSVFEFKLETFSVGFIYNRCTLLGLCKGVIDKPMLSSTHLFLYSYEKT